MVRTRKEQPRWVQSREAMVVTLNARQPEWRKVIVRDRKTGQLAEVALVGEEDPIDPGSEGTFYTFRRGERVLSDHPAVLEAPHLFVEADELVLAERK